MLAAGCDRLFAIDRLPDVTHDAGDVHDAERDATVTVDAPLECPGDFTYIASAHSYYKVVPTVTDWYAARAACKMLGLGTGKTHLAVLTDRAEYDVVAGNVPDSTTPWVGIHDDNTTDGQAIFTWVTAEPTGAVPWGASQPDQPDAQNCGRIRMTTGLDNENCLNFYTYVCECDAYVDPGI